MREEGAFVSLTQGPFLRAVRHSLAEAGGQADLGESLRMAVAPDGAGRLVPTSRLLVINRTTDEKGASRDHLPSVAKPASDRGDNDSKRVDENSRDTPSIDIRERGTVNYPVSPYRPYRNQANCGQLAFLV